MRALIPALLLAGSAAGAALGHATIAGANMPVQRAAEPVDDFDDGYRWARLAGVSDAGQCPGDTWSFARGCRAFLQHGGDL